ncbi:MAG: DUF819 family protein [Candidatus Omnitrophica bacterium]|nr:DUF819 family protein [Candidatus Omnitrophota bacterium]
MVKDPLAIIVILMAIEAMVLLAARQKRFDAVFNILPSVFFIYFLPMLASTFGLIDPKAPVLSLITTNILPMSLFLLLVTVDVRAIFRLGGKALGMFFIGSAGVIVGAAAAYVLVKPWVGAAFWAGFGALSASWTGGSANMIAVKEAMSVPDAVFLPMVVVDTIVPYVWMGLLIAAVKWQPAFDQWNRSERSVLDELKTRARGVKTALVKLTLPGGIFLLFCSAVAGLTAQYLARLMPQVKDILSPYAWAIIIVSFMGLGLSFTPARKMESAGATKIGYLMLYFVLTAIGAKASLSNVGASVILIGGGCVIIAVHLIFLLVGARILRAPLFLIAAASQANIGGVASAPVVAAVFEPGLASVGLLLAIMGNIVGTYLGILCAQLCRLFSA